MAAAHVDAESEETYSPEEYHPVENACWSAGEGVPYLAVAKTFHLLEQNRQTHENFSRILTNFFRSVIYLSPKDLANCVYLLLNEFGPSYTWFPTQYMSEKLLMKLFIEETGQKEKIIKSKAGTESDLGLIAMVCKQLVEDNERRPTLSVSTFFVKMKEIQITLRDKKYEEAQEDIRKLFQECTPIEACYLIRSVTRKSLGYSKMLIIPALGHSALLTPPKKQILNAASDWTQPKLKKKMKDATEAVRKAFCESPNWDLITSILLLKGIEGLATISNVTAGVPVKAMQSLPARSVDEVLKRFNGAEFIGDYKYDGERAQIHIKEDGKVLIFSRNSYNFERQYPDIIEQMPRVPKEGVKSAIIDAEAVKWDGVNQDIVPLLTLTKQKVKNRMYQGRRLGACVYAFDLLYLNGESLISQPLRRRRELLKEHFTEVEGEFQFVPSRKLSEPEAITEFMESSIYGKCEGLMVKKLDAPYEPDVRSENWLKLKSDYLKWIGDSLDLLVMGGYLNSASNGYSGFLLGCFNQDTGDYQTICKITTGFSDDELQTHSEFFKNNVAKEAKFFYKYDASLQPDHWFDAVQVWEVKATNFILSQVHKAAVGVADPDNGISLGFPRFLRIRDDKNPEDCTSSHQISEMYKSQVMSATVNLQQVQKHEEGAAALN